MITDCNFDRMFQLIESVFRQAHQDATKGDADALAFLQSYGAQPAAQGHRVVATNPRPRRKVTHQSAAGLR